MSKINIVKSNFVRQVTADSCGPACLTMILNWAGKIAEGAGINQVSVQQGGLSLLDLQRLAESVGLTCRPVEMEINYLKELKKPVILHTLNELSQNHFQVCFGYDKKIEGYRFLMADPAIQVHYIEEGELAEQWISKAALYFDDLNFVSSTAPKSSLLQLLAQRSYPLGLLVTVPFLSLAIASFGIALTWLLQKGLTNDILFKGHTLYAILSLLFFIFMFKNLFSFLRQYIMIQINLDTNNMLMGQSITKLLSMVKRQKMDVKSEVAYSLMNVQKIQNAISAFISVALSDGCMVILLIASSLYLFSLAGMINLFYVIAVVLWEIHWLPEFVYQAQRTKVLSQASEAKLAEAVLNPDQIDFRDNLDFRIYYANNLNLAKRLSIKLSKKYLLFECLGTINLIAVIITGVINLEAQHMDYVSFMLLVVEAYLTTALMQRICPSFQQIAEGADAAIAHNSK